MDPPGGVCYCRPGPPVVGQSCIIFIYQRAAYMSADDLQNAPVNELWTGGWMYRNINAYDVVMRAADRAESSELEKGSYYTVRQSQSKPDALIVSVRPTS